MLHYVGLVIPTTRNSDVLQEAMSEYERVISCALTKVTKVKAYT